MDHQPEESPASSLGDETFKGGSQNGWFIKENPIV